MAPRIERSTSPTFAHVRALDALARRGRLRRLIPRMGIDFTSNDFLGLAESPELVEAAHAALARGVPIGAGGSRLLRGNHAEHEALEAEAAAFFGSAAALYFGGGFSANAALIATLPSHGDLIVHDALIHASAWDGMAQTKATAVSARHNDPQAFEDAIRTWRAGGGVGRIWIAVESLYSMDGDCAPLVEFSALTDRHDAMLLIDEAHATGVLGPGGRGLAADLEGCENVVTLHTCGKALGASGALITCAAPLREFLINRARAFIYATAPSPLMAAVVRRSLALVRDEPERRARLADHVVRFGARLERATGIAPSGTHIQPIIVGADGRAVEVAGALQARGFDVRAIRPPTVPEGTARLRIVVTLNTSEAQAAALVDALADVLAGKPSAPTERIENRIVSPTQTEVQASFRVSSDGCVDPGLRRDDGLELGGRSVVVLDGLDGRIQATARNEQRAGFIVTGTGTGVGKTVFAAGLMQALDGVYWKPVQAGLDPDSDTDRVRVLSDLPAGRFLPEAYRLRTPVSPHEAAAREGVAIDPERLGIPGGERPLVIEGAGGLMVPLTDEVLFIDMFARWQLPVILVAGTGLGTINHTLLSIEALRSRGISIHGVAFVGEEQVATQAVIARRGGVRVLGRLPHLDPLDATSLRVAFAGAFVGALIVDSDR
jgi:8-amino-7-oxononanoate synthase